MTHLSMASETSDDAVRPAAPYSRDVAIVMLLFVLSVAVAHPTFFPALHEIGGWDESVYINFGRELIETGTLPRLSHNPAVAVFYAVTYLPFRGSDYWLVHSASLGRFLLFALLWLATVLVARRVVGLATPWHMIVLVAISPALVGLLNNGSNALFAASSGLALWQMLAFQQSRDLKHVWACSALIGIAALSRNEGPVLWVVFAGLTVVLTIPLRKVGISLVAASVPYFLLVGSAVAARGLVTGDYALGTAERSYITFEQGHGMAFADSYGTLQAYVEGQQDAPRLFGTAEENNHSILRAIRRNPQAYVERIPRLARSAAVYGLYVYNWHFAVLCGLLALRGVLELLRRGLGMQLAVLLLWPAYSALYILLCFQAAHLLIPFLTVYALAALGVSAVVTNLHSRTERRFWTAGLVGLTLAGAVAYGRPNDLLAAPLLLLAALWLMWVVAGRVRAAGLALPVASFVLLAAVLGVRLGVVHAEVRVLGVTAEERAVRYLQERLTPGTAVGSYSPGLVWTARMTHVQMVQMRDLQTVDDLLSWMDEHGVLAIYVNQELRSFEPLAWQLAEQGVGAGLDIGFRHDGDRSRGEDEILVLVRAPVTASLGHDESGAGQQP